jgi:hypothetical protein
LKPEDLVFIDEDAARETILVNQVNPAVASAEKEFKLMYPTSDPNGFQIYRAKK